ncbi:hypothetical protein C0Q70_14193 [Pomacea canaliculata]|uniref:EGF-like domain-containing protein n=1 Tax=Pomacea canaliculata TaxID=400727 RepID=A0A2T7NZE7_POMCA|nr:hypothetical protein C0Q70_14193 [Pomacea canaliculata]
MSLHRRRRLRTADRQLEVLSSLKQSSGITARVPRTCYSRLSTRRKMSACCRKWGREALLSRGDRKQPDDNRGFHCDCQPGYSSDDCRYELKRMLQFVILSTEQLDIPLNKSAATDKVTATVTTVLPTPGLRSDMSVPQPDSGAGPASSLKSVLSITPSLAGQHHVCVQLHDPPSGDTDSVCYLITSQDPGSVSGSGGSSTPGGVGESTTTAPKQCTILFSVPVRSQAVGVYAFDTFEVDSSTCGTNMLVDSHTLGSQEACMEVGFGGERRCYKVAEVDSTNTTASALTSQLTSLGSETGASSSSSVTSSSSDYVSASTPLAFITRPSHVQHPPLFCGRCVCTNPVQTGNEDTPVNANTTQPHAVVPTLPSGLQITCDIGETCQIPVYVNGDPRFPLTVNRGPSSPEVVTAVSSPVKDNSTGISVVKSVTVCDSTGSWRSSRSGRFSPGTPPGGTTVVCHKETPCHMIAFTEKSSNGNCSPVVPASSGVFIFKTNPSDQSTCGSDVLLVPTNSSQNVCIAVGANGEIRCFQVEVANDTASRHHTHSTNWSQHQLLRRVYLSCTCLHGRVPIRLRAILGTFPGVTTSLSSPGLTSTVSDPHPDNITGTPSGLRSTLIVTPSQAGQHHVCVDIKDQSGVPVQPGSLGVHTFETHSEDVITCGTVMLIDPLTLSNGEACIDAGSGGERRCYTVTLVNDTNDPCAVNPCHNGGQCINTPPSYVCACPAQYAANANCDDQGKENTPVNPDASQLNPHAVVPTLPSGLQITCDVGKTCQVPVYVNGDARAPLVVSRGPSSPKVVTAVSPPIKDNSTGIPLMTSLLSLTPQEAGDHHVCVDIVGSDVKAVDHVCYFIISRANETSVSPTTNRTSGRFTARTPPDGATVVCHESTPCHIIASTEKNSSGTGVIPVVPASSGVFVFQTNPSDQSTCGSDILLVPTNSSQNVCMAVGVDGENRCFQVETENNSSNICKEASPCINGGICVNKRTAPLAMFVPAPCCLQASTVVKLSKSCRRIYTLEYFSSPHAIIPTAPTGLTLTCYVGSTCRVPVFLVGSPLGTFPGVNTSLSSPGLTSTVSDPHPDSITGTSKRPEVNSYVNSDTVCYLINSVPKQGSTNNGSTIPPINGGRFADTTPANGSQIVCHSSRPCRFISYTEQPANTPCIPVQNHSLGVFTFETLRIDSSTCGTVMMIDPGNLKNREACIETGSGEERRCYLVGLVNDTNDPCDVKPCHNGGQCINTPPSYVCACPTQYSASGNCDEQDTSSVEPSTLLTTSGVDHSSVTAVSSVSSPMTPTTVSLKCAILNCSADALCTLIQSKPVCLCPLGQSGVQCLTRNENIPVNSDADQLNIPSHCQPGTFSPEVVTAVASPVNDNSTGIPLMQSLLSVTPQEAGDHHVCVDVMGPDIIPVVPASSGVFVFKTNPSDQNTCGSDVLLVPTNSSQNVCMSVGANGEVRCFQVETENNYTHPSEPFPGVNTNVSSPGLTSSVSDPHPDNITGTPSGLRSTLSVTPSETGQHHVCVDIKEQSGVSSDTVCYLINSVAKQGSTSSESTVQPTHGGSTYTPSQKGVGRFADTTPANGSQIVCHSSRPCRFISHTEQPANTPCTPVQPFGWGVHTFETLREDSSTCGTVMLIDPPTLGSREVCTEAGFGGETRCYSVSLVDDANQVSLKCAILNCSADAKCTLIQSKPMCLCPLGQSGVQCLTRNENIPVNPDAGQLNPHAVVPTLPSGLQITCDVGDTCQVPVYVNANSRFPLTVSRGPSSPEVVTDVAQPVKDNSTGIPLITSLLSVTPQEAGDHHVCVDVAGPDVNTVDHICYFINSRPKGTSVSPTGNHLSGRFSVGTPPDGTTVVCHEDTPCHLIALTQKNSSGSCIPVVPASSGVFVFKTNPSHQNTCCSDVLLVPTNSSQNVCMSVG